MQFRFFNTGQVYSVLFTVIFSSFAFAQLDWNNDVVVFGTEQHERNPRIVSIGPGDFRAFCVRDSNTLSMRTSEHRGEVWNSYVDAEVNSGYARYSIARDNLNTYVANYSLGGEEVHFRKIAHDSVNWRPPSNPLLSQENSGIIDVCMISDYEFELNDPYIHMFGLARDHNGSGSLCHLYGSNHGASWSEIRWFQSDLSIQDSSSSIAAAVTWLGENERLWAAITLDRPGTVDEQVVLYYSDDLGQTWSNGLTPDSSSYEQLYPTMIGYEETIMLAYERRNSASIAHDIYFVYSPDNGVSWSEPLQLTDHAFDDTRPELELSSNVIGLFYGRVQVQQAAGQLLFRQAPLSEPWAWETETAVSENNAFHILEGYSATSDGDGFAAAWCGRLVGDDADVFFDASWRGTAVNEPRFPESSGALFTQNPVTGRIEYELTQGAHVVAKLYNMLGRTVNQTTLSGSRGIWSVPENLPSGSYWLSAKSSIPLRIQIIR